MVSRRRGNKMKKSWICTLLFIVNAIYASPVGNPASPQLLQDGYFIPCDSWVSLRFGYEGDFVGDEQMNQCVEGSGRVDNYTQTTNSGIVTFNFLDHLDVYGVF